MEPASRSVRRSIIVAAVLFAFAAGSMSGMGASRLQETSADRLAADAAAAREAGRLEEAAALYRRAIELQPESPEHRWFLGATLYELTRYADARAAFTAVMQRQPEHAGAFGMRGLCAFQLGQHEDALRDLLQARALGINRTPELARTVRYHLGILLTRFADYEVGHQVLAEFAAEGNESPSVIDALGLNLLRRPLLPGDLEAGERPLVQLAGRAAFAMAARRSAEAARTLDELVTRHPRTPNVHYARGVFLLAEAPDRAIDDFRRELEISPDHVPARLQLAFEYLRRGEPGAARPPAEEAVQRQPHYFASHLALGQVMFELGRLQEAIAAFELAVTLAPESAQTHFMLSRAYARAGRTADAERERQEFVRLDSLARQQRTGPQSIGGAGALPVGGEPRPR